jgi:hypothetical protein
MSTRNIRLLHFLSLKPRVWIRDLGPALKTRYGRRIAKTRIQTHQMAIKKRSHVNCTVKWGNIVIGFYIVTSVENFLTSHNSRSNEFIRLVKKLTIILKFPAYFIFNPHLMLM